MGCNLENLYLRSYVILFQDILDEISIMHILWQRDVIVFACGIMADPSQLVNFIYEKIFHYRRETMLEETLLLKESDKIFSNALYLESKVSLPGSPLGNTNMNYFHTFISADHKLQRPIMYIPSKVYIFNSLNCEFDTFENRLFYYWQIILNHYLKSLFS